MRDATVGETLYFFFTTRTFSTGAPGTLGGTPVLSVYEENNTTQITAGVSLSVDFDTVTGLNQATVVATGANGYEAGKSYAVVITTGTVGGVSVVGEVVAEFTLEASSAFTRLGAPAGASVSADIATIDTNVDAILVDTGTTLPATLATAQADLDTITGPDGVTLATTQGAITWGAVTISVTGATDNITIAGSGTGDGLAFTRSGSGDLYDTAWATDVQTQVTASINTYDPPTRAELTTDTNSILTRLGTPAGADVSTDIAAIKSDTAAVLVDTADMQPKLGTPAADISADIAAVKVDTAATLVDTNELQGDWTNGGRLDLLLDAIKAVTDNIPASGALNNLSAADVNAQVLDVLNTDTFAELSSVPAATTTLTNMIRFLYALGSNELNQTSTTATLRNRADSADIGTATVSDDGTTAVRGSYS